jgi:hypothetical protein
MPISTRLFSQKITIAPFLTRDGYNEPTYGPSYPAQCREETDYHYIRDTFGEIATSSTVLYVYSPKNTPYIEDKVTLIDSTFYPIKHILHNRNDNGKVEFYTIVIGK